MPLYYKITKIKTYMDELEELEEEEQSEEDEERSIEESDLLERVAS